MLKRRARSAWLTGCLRRAKRSTPACWTSPARLQPKSPLAIRGTKEMITYARDHSVADGLNYIATWNAAMLMSQDLTEAMAASAGQRPPVFKN